MQLVTEPSSFRDPDGGVFFRDDTLYRQINGSYRDSYEHLMRSGLYTALFEAGLLIPHERVGLEERYSDGAYAVIRPERIPFVSYPYEWCFSQLKDAALVTLRVQREALRFGMSLKDASAYNVQFRRGCRPIFIDTLSFEQYVEGRPWVAYRQFCQHFLAPLALMAHVDIRLSELLQSRTDGIPLDFARKILPMKDWLDPALLLHVNMHSLAQQRIGGASWAAAARKPSGPMSRNALSGLLESLEGGIQRLTWRPRHTEWSDYYEKTSYGANAFATKKRIVERFLSEVTPTPRHVCDLGANTGVFSRIASSRGIPTIACDADATAVEKNYRICQMSGEQSLLPLVQDITHPSPGLGWAHEERKSFLARQQNSHTDVAFALALVHHLAISNNVPLARIAHLMGQVARFLIIEFVPKEDPQVQRLLARRKDIFPDYSATGFATAFSTHFSVLRRESVSGTQRSLYLMRRRDPA